MRLLLPHHPNLLSFRRGGVQQCRIPSSRRREARDEVFLILQIVIIF